MKRALSLVFALSGLAAAGCHSAPPADLAESEVLYQPTGFATRLPGDRTVFVAPVVDERRPPVESGLAEFPVLYDADQRWQRPVVAMVDDLLRRELESSHVFTAIVDQPARADVVLVPTLVSFATAAIEQESGGRSLAEVRLRIHAYGPLGSDGNRPLLLDQVFGDRQVTDLAFRTASRHVLAGTVTRGAMLRLLQGLDGKSVGRAGMPPLATDAPAIPGIPAPVPAAAEQPAAPDR